MEQDRPAPDRTEEVPLPDKDDPPPGSEDLPPEAEDLPPDSADLRPDKDAPLLPGTDRAARIPHPDSAGHQTDRDVPPLRLPHAKDVKQCSVRNGCGWRS